MVEADDYQHWSWTFVLEVMFACQGFEVRVLLL